MTLDKSKLLEWLDVEIDLSTGDKRLAEDKWAFKHIKKEIERGAFDVIEEEAPTLVFVEPTFKVGDRVRSYKGKGTVVSISGSGGIGVEHDEFVGGHELSLSAEETTCKKGHGWWFRKDHLDLLGGEVDEQARE